MKDLTLPGGLVTRQDLSKPQNKGLFSLRKMFWKYLKILHVAFTDECCPEADDSDRQPIAWDSSLGEFVTWDGTAWVAVTSFTTTTTTSSTTITTTAAPTTTSSTTTETTAATTTTSSSTTSTTTEATTTSSSTTTTTTT